MNERGRELHETLKKFSDMLPKFPDGRIDYTESDTAPVTVVFIRFRDKLLLLKRSDKVLNYKGKWNAVAAFLDEIKSIEEKALEETRQETGIGGSAVKSIHLGRKHTLADPKIGKIWIVYPVIIDLAFEPRVKLDWEHTDYAWISQSQLKEYAIVPGLEKNLHYAAL